ncbi:hypothetical protein KSC_097050 [Ktedonobacter sp. SOSP1-52]|uniref:GNAT family N-acetyltransferase n=1 Tax=Ktedonobacter sp. SOSP1-52 TaxID=2778366 RepID=UPI0019161194|nr:GNAT family N-acetyltransferase [Ktedonobacter sp. SOSP1-52]GHO70813.1 hypothetical protein KSC_097050 [Ktedonobacter sp. SOSP1-52]
MQEAIHHSYRRDLGAGLVLRWSTVEDIERIAMLYGMVHRDKADAPLNTGAMRSIRTYMSGHYPLMGPNDFGIVEDTSRDGNPVVATTCFWKHTWTYEGIPFNVGRPECVATDPAYRHRGLVRALFEMFHARSEAEGDLAQAITGIAYFYRQFGYEYALELEDRRATPIVLIPEAREGEPESFTLRAATVKDIPLIEALYNRRQASSMVSDSTRTLWHYEIETWKKHPQLRHTFNFQVIVDTSGEAVGFVGCDASRRGKVLGVWLLEFAPGINMQSAMPPLLRALRSYGLAMETSRPDTPALQEISFSLGTTHPAHDVLGEVLDHPTEPPYAWYVRVKDLPAFLMHIAPALEKRLAASPVAGYTGDLKLDFYRDGLCMRFEQGRLVAVEPWRTPLYGADPSASFPPLIFLQVLFGHRSIEELRHVFPDIWVNPEARLLLRALFPTRPSFVFGWN